MLFVPTQWVAAVYAVNHTTSDPPGPRFKWRDATLLHRFIRPPVVGEPAHSGIASGQGGGCVVSGCVVSGCVFSGCVVSRCLFSGCLFSGGVVSAGVVSGGGGSCGSGRGDGGGGCPVRVLHSGSVGSFTGGL